MLQPKCLTINRNVINPFNTAILMCKVFFDIHACKPQIKTNIPLCSESTDHDATKRLEIIIHLAELCMDVLQQNEEHHYEVNNRRLHCYQQFAVTNKLHEVYGIYM